MNDQKLENLLNLALDSTPEELYEICLKITSTREDPDELEIED